VCGVVGELALFSPFLPHRAFVDYRAPTNYVSQQRQDQSPYPATEFALRPFFVGILVITSRKEVSTSLFGRGTLEAPVHSWPTAVIDPLPWGFLLPVPAPDPQHHFAMIMSSFLLPSTSSALRLSQSAAPAVAKGRSPIFHRGHDGIFLSHANAVFSPRRCRLAVSSCRFIWRVMVSSFNSKGISTLRPMAWSIGSSLRDQPLPAEHIPETRPGATQFGRDRGQPSSEAAQGPNVNVTPGP
jgi:hypothetical protein